MISFIIHTANQTRLIWQAPACYVTSVALISITSKILIHHFGAKF